MPPLLALCALLPQQDPPPVLERLSPPGQRAFRFLTSIDYFHAGDAGFAGRAPDAVRAMRWLWREEHAAGAFHALFDRDEPAHQLYGLVGLYYADPAAIQMEVKALRDARATVPFMTSCTYDEDHRVSRILAVTQGEVVRLDHSRQSIAEWAEKYGKQQSGYALDIVGGGYPNLYRDAGGRRTPVLWPLPPAPEDDVRFAPEQLSPEGRRAFEILRETERFTDGAIGIAGVTPPEVMALRWLWREPAAAHAFHALLQDPRTSVGCDLYALCGLYYAHPRCFREIAHAFAGRDDVVPYQSGCILNQEKPVAELVRSPLEGAARLAPGQTTREWVQANATGEPYAIDVIGGGFPDLFRHAGGWHEPRLEPLPPAKAGAAEPDAPDSRD